MPKVSQPLALWLRDFSLPKLELIWILSIVHPKCQQQDKSKLCHICCYSEVLKTSRLFTDLSFLFQICLSSRVFFPEIIPENIQLTFVLFNLLKWCEIIILIATDGIKLIIFEKLHTVNKRSCDKVFSGVKSFIHSFHIF